MFIHLHRRDSERVRIIIIIQACFDDYMRYSLSHASSDCV